MIVQGALSCGQGAEPIQQELIVYRQGYEEALQRRFEMAQTQSQFTSRSESFGISQYLATIQQGMSFRQQVKRREKLLAVVRQALQN